MMAIDQRTGTGMPHGRRAGRPINKVSLKPATCSFPKTKRPGAGESSVCPVAYSPGRRSRAPCVAMASACPGTRSSRRDFRAPRFGWTCGAMAHLPWVIPARSCGPACLPPLDLHLASVRLGVYRHRATTMPQTTVIDAILSAGPFYRKIEYEEAGCLVCIQR